MPCSGCAAQFSVLRRRRACQECARWFCAACAARRVCAACRVLLARPAAAALRALRVRDLQAFLQRRHVSTAGCVEKDDLVRLALAHVHSADFAPRAASSPAGEFSQTLANLKGFASNVWSALDIGAHDKAKNNGRAAASQPTPPPTAAPTTSRPERRPSPPPEAEGAPRAREDARAPPPPESPPRVSPDGAAEASASTGLPVEPPDTDDCLEVEDDPDDPDWEIVSPPADPLPRDSDVLLLDDGAPLRASGRAVSDLDLPSRTGDGGDTSSLKDVPAIVSRRAESRINLSDLKDLSQVEALKVKQLKELLILNRVDFKGCCERNELLERAKRLWQENTKSREDLEAAESQELCKICMDAPMECVMLECGHIATCINCGKRLAECPICRGYVIRVVRFFRS